MMRPVRPRPALFLYTEHNKTQVLYTDFARTYSFVNTHTFFGAYYVNTAQTDTPVTSCVDFCLEACKMIILYAYKRCNSLFFFSV